MPKSLKIYIGILLLILIGIMVIDANRPKPIDWRPTFSLNDKIPFGLYVFSKEYKKSLLHKKSHNLENHLTSFLMKLTILMRRVTKLKEHFCISITNLI